MKERLVTPTFGTSIEWAGVFPQLQVTRTESISAAETSAFSVRDQVNLWDDFADSRSRFVYLPFMTTRFSIVLPISDSAPHAIVVLRMLLLS